MNHTLGLKSTLLFVQGILVFKVSHLLLKLSLKFKDCRLLSEAVIVAGSLSFVLKFGD
jgi:hypothetical protein